MNSTAKRKINVAILDLYERTDNQGMRCLRELLFQFEKLKNLELIVDEFEVRKEIQLPGTAYDIYISSGGPGSPIASKGSEWENAYFEWLQSIIKYNDNPLHLLKKKVFFICHSFQLASRFFEIADVTKRKSTSFGVFPVHCLNNSNKEPIFEGLGDPFYAVDSRDFQVVNPHHEKLNELGANILAIEKARPHVPYERAIMAIRFNEHMIGTQFHPEADAIGMLIHLQGGEKKKTVIENHGEQKWKYMIEQLNDPDKIMNTYSHVLPNFLETSLNELISK